MFSHDTNPFVFKDSLNFNDNKKFTVMELFSAVMHFGSLHY